MRELILHKKTGFRIRDMNKPVIIRDFRGKLFYETESRLPRVQVFNLPPGKYYVDAGSFYELPKPNDFELPRLPKRERHNKPFPSHFKFRFAPNPNKCTIFWGRKEIICDPSLKNASLPILYFILFHEFAHSKYGTEKYADLGAAYMMLKRGFNPTQIMRAPILSLSKRQRLRKNYLKDKLTGSSQKLNK